MNGKISFNKLNKKFQSISPPFEFVNEKAEEDEQEDEYLDGEFD